MKINNLKAGLKEKLLLIYVLLCSVTVSYAENFSFYSEEPTNTQTSQNDYLLNKEESNLFNDETEFTFYDQDLKAPPGGGPPIGGVPVEDGCLLICLLGVGFYFLKEKKVFVLMKLFKSLR